MQNDKLAPRHILRHLLWRPKIVRGEVGVLNSVPVLGLRRAVSHDSKAILPGVGRFRDALRLEYEHAVRN